MAVTIVDVSDSGGSNIAVVANAALMGTEYALTVRNIESSANANLRTSQVSIGSAQFQVSSTSPDTYRRSVRIKNGSVYTIYLGSDNTVTTSTGYALLAGEGELFELGPAKDIWGVSVSGSSGVAYVVEIA
jgi:hypothetical protein